MLGGFCGTFGRGSCRLCGKATSGTTYCEECVRQHLCPTCKQLKQLCRCATARKSRRSSSKKASKTTKR